LLYSPTDILSYQSTPAAYVPFSSC
jgi:hypothetical protein